MKSPPNYRVRKSSPGCALVLMLFIGGLIVATVYFNRTKASGELRRAGDLGDGAFEPAGCSAGQHAGFFGAEFDAKDGARLRVVRDAANVDAILVRKPGAEAFVTVQRAACRRFDVSIEEGNVSANHVRGINAKLDVDCPNLHGILAGESCF